MATTHSKTTKWQTWFTHDDGTPRVMYMKLSEQAELVLSKTFDGFEAKIELKAPVWHTKTFEIESDNKITDTAIQAWAETKAVCYLEDLAEMASKAANLIKDK